MSINGNTLLSAEATAVVKRVIALREFTKKTGFATTGAQAQELLKLNNTDLLAAADYLSLGGERIKAGKDEFFRVGGGK